MHVTGNSMHSELVYEYRSPTVMEDPEEYSIEIPELFYNNALILFFYLKNNALLYCFYCKTTR